MQIEEIFSSAGVLSKNIPGYLPRAIQLEMALAIAQALDHKQVLIAEAGTGTGKTYAYLIPSLLSGKKVIISTGTKNLQDQLFHRDIPRIRNVLGIPLKIAVLKGRANYICQHRLNTYLQTRFISDDATKILYQIKEWVDDNKDGEIDHIPGVKPPQHLLPYMTSTTDNCLGQECEFYSKCYVIKARKQAQEAGILIVNHHLFFADSQLKDSGVTDLLPASDAVIFDEAHQLHEIATHFLGESISGNQLLYLARDIQAEQQTNAPDMLTLKITAQKVIIAVKEMHSAFGSVAKGSWDHIVNKPQIKLAIQSLQEALIPLLEAIEAASVRSRGLDNCWRRTADLASRFKKLTTVFPQDQIHWYDVQENNFTLHHTPINIGDYFQNLIKEQDRAWIFTSATLSVNGDFSHFESHLGLTGANHLHLESPFDYSKQALLYLPNLMKLPSDEAYISNMIDFVVPILNLTKGRAFLLFTSHRALKEATQILKERVTFPLLIQGNAPKTKLLATFCELEDAVLLGTSSFWEGVDVKGNALSCVIIDKIPFLAPDDPILKSRLEHYKRQGKNPFNEYQLPQAVITLRQGSGRLIRDIGDKGVLMICDPRITSKDYGRVFLDSLPPMPQTQSIDDVAHFLQGSCA